jgi:hypothetical protein
MGGGMAKKAKKKAKYAVKKTAKKARRRRGFLYTRHPGDKPPPRKK